MQGCGRYVGVGKFCQGCGFNRSIHRRWRVLDGGKKGRVTMTATGEAFEIAGEQRRMGVAMATKALQLSDAGGAVWMTVNDSERWDELKALVKPARIKLIGGWERVCEAFVAHVGDLVVHASGPTWAPSDADFRRMISEREEG